MDGTQVVAAEGLTRLAARQALAYRTAALEPAAIVVAKQCILDWFGVTLQGATEPCATIVTETLRDGGQGPCTVVGSQGRFSSRDAALANGTASHALDYDDVNARMAGHPTVAILPAVLAVGESTGASGADALRAFIGGYEVACLLGAAAAPSHYARGFHATGTIGALGAAVAAGLLLDLDEDGMATALALAATQAAGLKAMFGSMAKPFHAGKAAANGVLAAQLAARGFQAPDTALEAPQGFLSTLSDEALDGTPSVPTPGSEILNTLFKYHAACYLTHSSLDAIVRLREANGLDPRDVAQVELHVSQGHLHVCNIPDPVSALETKFSLRHAAALALTGADTAAISTFCDAVAVDPEIVALRSRVTVTGDMPPGGLARVVIRRANGPPLSLEHNTGVPDSDLARQGRRISAKFRSLAAPTIGLDRAEALEAEVSSLDAAPSLADLMAAATPG